jgi:hypothetical protein
MSTKSLSFAAFALIASLSMAKAQVFTDGALALDGSNVEAFGAVVYAANFGYNGDAVINGVTFAGTSQIDGSYQGGNFSINGVGGLDGTGGGTTGASAGVVALNVNGLFYSFTLTLNNLTPGTSYAAQLIVDGDAGDDAAGSRSQQFTDTTNTSVNPPTSNVATTDPGPEYVTDTFTATGTSETINALNSGGQGAEFSGFVLETAPEPSTWVLMGLGLAGVAFCVVRRSQVRC